MLFLATSFFCIHIDAKIAKGLKQIAGNFGTNRYINVLKKRLEKV